MSSKPIDTERFSAKLRTLSVDPVSKRVRVTNFSNSKQEEDLALPPNCGGFGRVHHFNVVQGECFPRNPLPIEPAARFLRIDPPSEMEAQVFQNASCSWRCWYCFVDFSLLSADKARSADLTADELIDLFLLEPHRPRIIDLSGGQPDLVPEWTYWMAEALHRRGLASQYFLWSDDNLSNDYLWRHLSTVQIDFLVGQPNYARVGCFKGFDPPSFSFNTRAEPALFIQQFRLMKRLVDYGFDVYGYATFTSLDDGDLARKMNRFVDQLQENVHPRFPLRVVPLRIRDFKPMAGRIPPSEHARALAIQTEAVQAWNHEISRRFGSSASGPIWGHSLR